MRCNSVDDVTVYLADVGLEHVHAGRVGHADVVLGVGFGHEQHLPHVLGTLLVAERRLLDGVVDGQAADLFGELWCGRAVWLKHAWRATRLSFHGLTRRLRRQPYTCRDVSAPFIHLDH